MAQGKLKVKKKLPAAVKSKKAPGRAVTKRSNAPVKPKNTAANKKMKAIVSKMVNKKAEREIRSLAVEGAKPLSRAQEAAVKHATRNAASSTAM